MKNMKKSAAWIIIIIAILVLAVAGIFLVETVNRRGGLGIGKPSKTAVIDLTVTTVSLIPDEFTVKAGQTVILSVTSDDREHYFKFDNPELDLKGAIIEISDGQTKSVTFEAPTEPGDYLFYCDIPEHFAAGEASIMHVE